MTGERCSGGLGGGAAASGGGTGEPVTGGD